MTKEEVIQQAYGIHWDEVRDYVRMEDGSLGTFKSFDTDDDFDDLLLCNFWYEQLGFSRDELDHSIGGDMEPTRWRPLSLVGIEDNNGWQKIESEEDLPKVMGVYNIIHFDGYFGRDQPFNPNDSYYWINFITHWREREKIKNPLW